MERTEKFKIYEICKRQEIEELVHFTHIDNLLNILRMGLIGRAGLEMLSPGKFKVNDNLRLDRYPEAVCLSISFPNYRMFYKYRSQCQGDWVVISLDPRILWVLDCAFFRNNAASKEMTSISLEECKTAKAFESFFADFDNVKRNQNLPRSYPTNPQAEVLVFGKIRRNFIKKVYFCNDKALEKWSKRTPFFYSKNCIVNEDYFKPRIDWEIWSSKKSINVPYQDFSEILF